MKLISLVICLTSLTYAQWFYQYVGDSRNDIEVTFGDPHVVDKKSDIYHYFNDDFRNSVNFKFRSNKVIESSLIVLTVDKSSAQKTLKQFVARFKENGLQLISQTKTLAIMKYGAVNVRMAVEPAQKEYRLNCTAKK